MRKLNELCSPVKKILFLGYNENETQLINSLIQKNCAVEHAAEKIDGTGSYDFVVSYGYRHILTADVIDRLACPIFNLHISYLPFNRGAHPNFWSFYDNTPSGVTVHLIDDGIDTGPIVVQKYVNFTSEHDTFDKTHKLLISEIEKLFVDHIDLLLADEWIATKQKGIGSHHYVKDLPANFSGWSANIREEIKRLNEEGLHYE